MEGKMKNLNVKWLPETFAIVSLSFSAGPSAESGATILDQCDRGDVPGKLIIISDGGELRAEVATLG